MKTVCDLDMCNGCMACIDKCPKQSIKLCDSLFSYNAVINVESCINCGLCEKVCPNKSLVSKESQIYCYQGWANDEIRKQATSGGIATTLLIDFVKAGGYVSACLFRDGKFIFELTNDLDNIKHFFGSKYVKSDPTGIYQKIKERLKTDKVLFVGLPCQVAALKNYIGSLTNLYTIDLICHGTPSPKLLQKSLRDYHIKLEDVENISFRDKNDMGISINQKRLIGKRVADEYTCAFLSAIDYTENCYSCQFATIKRVSDITLGDSWGTNLVDEEKNGVSLILIQTNKGAQLINKSNLCIKNVDINNAIEHNHQLKHPSKKYPGRDRFIKSIESGETFRKSIWRVIPVMLMKQQIKKVIFK